MITSKAMWETKWFSWTRIVLAEKNTTEDLYSKWWFAIWCHAACAVIIHFYFFIRVFQCIVSWFPVLLSNMTIYSTCVWHSHWSSIASVQIWRNKVKQTSYKCFLNFPFHDKVCTHLTHQLSYIKCSHVTSLGMKAVQLHCDRWEPATNQETKRERERE